MNLDGRAALVTGAGRGIGWAVARELAQRGARLLLCSRSADEIEAAAGNLRRGGADAEAWVTDVGDPKQVEALAERALDRLGSVDILVNNAGIATSAPLGRQSLEEWRRLFAVNVEGSFLLTRALLPGMTGRRWGRIVNVASIAGRTGAAYLAAYSASKHAVIGLTRSLAAEVAGKGVTVNAVCPGYVATPMTETSIERIVERSGGEREEVRAKLVATNPQGRMIEADEVAYAVAFLCDERARGINGQTLGIDGGAFLG